ncbi:MAG: ATP synthase F1 subunit gamma [Erysipelotrichaceae bacterium]|nr:ATP synthase F1 subunit gamma [Erysipelotrichaceae bacterium]
MAQLNLIKKRLKSVESTQKLTGATGLVASVKMQRYRYKIQTSDQYSEDIYRFIEALFSTTENIENPYLKKGEIDNPAYLIICGDSGMCGGFNNELLKYTVTQIDKKVPIYVIGQVGYLWLEKNRYNIQKYCLSGDDIDGVYEIANILLEKYRRNEISEINVIYSRFVNTLMCSQEMVRVLPFSYEGEKRDNIIIFEPSQDELINNLIPMYVKSLIVRCLYQSKTSEASARKNAMDTAKKNADKLIEELQLNYNKARQQAITQEMNEIISASEK